MEKLNRALEPNTGKIQIKRKFTLNSKSDLDVWLDQLYSDLSEYKLTEHINNPDTEKFRNDVSENTIRMKNKIRGTILNHIYTNYYKMLQSFCDRFNEIIKEYTCNTTIPLSEEEISKSGFL